MNHSLRTAAFILATSGVATASITMEDSPSNGTPGKSQVVGEHSAPTGSTTVTVKPTSKDKEWQSQVQEYNETTETWDNVGTPADHNGDGIITLGPGKRVQVFDVDSSNSEGGDVIADVTSTTV